MKDSYYKKNLVFGIIVLFIGASVVPTISGNIGKTSNQSTIQGLTYVPLSDDYVNAYWKFDEGSGNIAHDSSGHNYDGTIYGATWTTGYSSYALDFDGVNDNVTLDAYAQNHLGFNKTDDLIFSFYFNSISADLGMIYSISNSPSYPYNPGVHIALNSNGTLEFKVWKGGCGIVLTSEGTYNDGNWHYVEIFYNGIYGIEGVGPYPTVDMYVDNVLDNNVTEWVCNFYADQFHLAKIGTRANDSTYYFDGVIDEFKIIKYPGGNQPPNISIISGPTSGEAGVEYTYTFVTTDPEGDDIWLYIDWGDDTTEEWSGPYESGEEVTLGHTWNENGTYEIRVKARDSWGESPWSDTYQVIIGNRAPNPPSIHGSTNGKIKTEYSYTFAAVDPDGDNVKYFIDWGDGNTEWTDYHASGEEVTVKHTWSKEGTYTIQAKAKDTHGAESGWGKLVVTMPKNKQATQNTKFLQIFEQLMNHFPLLARLLNNGISFYRLSPNL